MRPLSRRPVPIAVLGALLLSGCAETTAPRPIDSLPRDLSAGEQQLIAASNSFAFDLLRQVAGEVPDGNVFLSPLSASMALGMTMNGARGSTFDAMSGTLGFAGMDPAAINASYRSLIDLLRGLDPKVQMLVANSVWYRNGFTVEAPFLDATRSYFDAEVEPLDFADPASVGTINDWVRENTKGRIDSIVDRIDPLDMMILVNAVYFKGDWTSRFTKSDTYDAPFYDPDGHPSGTVRMMRREGPVQLYRGPDFAAVDLPYGGGAFSMTVILPDPGVDVDGTLASLTPARWREITDGFAGVDLTIHLPKFRLEYEKHLVDALTGLGMGVAFSDAADFTGIHRGGGLLISDVLQKTFVNVDEEGTEAAAATSVVVGTTSTRSPEIVVNRPFVFAIRERYSGSILFIGRMTLPAAD
jgi:serpin B